MDKIIVNSKLFKGLLSKLLTKYLRKQIETNGRVGINSFILDHRQGKVHIDASVTLELYDEDIKKIILKMED